MSSVIRTKRDRKTKKGEKNFSKQIVKLLINKSSSGKITIPKLSLMSVTSYA